jgi:hypothetical protein
MWNVKWFKNKYYCRSYMWITQRSIHKVLLFPFDTFWVTDTMCSISLEHWNAHANFPCNRNRILYMLRKVKFFTYATVTWHTGRTIDQVASCQLPTAVAQVQAQVRSRGVRVGQSGTGAGFLRVLRFPLPIIIPPTASHTSSSIIRGWYNRPNSGWHAKWTQSEPTPQKKANNQIYWQNKSLLQFSMN